ncbi:MAG: hypothetical protein IJT30_06910 [Muribaculaceae bacterium]|nr:hypothetical protein [Muribaculaceae bacterium]
MQQPMQQPTSLGAVNYKTLRIFYFIAGVLAFAGVISVVIFCNQYSMPYVIYPLCLPMVGGLLAAGVVLIGRGISIK